MREIDAGGAKLQRGIIEKVEKSTVIIEVIQEVIEMLKTVFTVSYTHLTLPTSDLV